MTYRKKTGIFTDPVAGAEYFGQCALLSIWWWPRHRPECRLAEVFINARVAARYAIRALREARKGN